MKSKFLWYTMRQDHHGEFDIHGFAEAPESSVLAGQTIKHYIETLPNEAACRAKYPDIKFGSRWTDPQVSLAHLSDEGDY